MIDDKSRARTNKTMSKRVEENKRKKEGRRKEGRRKDERRRTEGGVEAGGGRRMTHPWQVRMMVVEGRDAV